MSSITNLSNFQGAKFGWATIVEHITTKEVYQILNINKTQGVEDLYLVQNLQTKQKINLFESTLVNYEKPLKHTVTIKGAFPAIFVEYISKKKYVDYKQDFKVQTIICTQKEFTEIWEECFTDETYFKVIGTITEVIQEENEQNRSTQGLGA